MAPEAQIHQPHRINPARIIIGVLLFIALVLIAWIVRTHTHHTVLPSVPSAHTRQDSGNKPPGGSVDQGGNPHTDTTPSPNGTNGNTVIGQ